MTCPTCLGRKGRTVYACPGFRAVHIACETCGGTGDVTAEESVTILTAFADGEALRHARIERRESMRDAAARLGVDVARYSRIEHGLETLPSDLAAKAAGQ